MIRSKQDLYDYLRADAAFYKSQSGGVIKSLNSRRIDTPISDQWYIWKYIKAMRMVEYYLNTKGFAHRILHKYWLLKFRRYSYKTGFQIAPNTCGKGLCIYHWGYILINGRSRLGDYCAITSGVVIGQTSKDKIPLVGNHVTICSGAKIVGNVSIGDNAIIAPNTVVIEDVPANATVSGVPAKIIRQR